MSAIGTKQTLACALHMSAFGVKRTCLFAPQMSAYDPKRTFGRPFPSAALTRYDGPRAWG